MTRIKLINFLMKMILKFQNILHIVYDYLNDMKFLVLVDESERLYKEIDELKDAEKACKKQQDILWAKAGSIEKELDTYRYWD